MNKTVLGVYPGPRGHWVGDGFPVRSLFDYNRFGAHVSPFLLLDYAAPADFEPATRPRGVGEHPHRGFETWDVQLLAGKSVKLALPAGHTALVAVLRGAISANGSKPAGSAEMVLLDANGGDLTLEASTDSTVLVLSGVPLNEPIVGYGPFVMNSAEEIDTAMKDFQRGKFGRIPAREADTEPA
jgi:redox-sensitive bicupin YhaK (pirin superfamily)